MEKELAKMRAGLDESVQLMEQREMNTNIEYAIPSLLHLAYSLFMRILGILGWVGRWPMPRIRMNNEYAKCQLEVRGC